MISSSPQQQHLESSLLAQISEAILPLLIKVLKTRPKPKIRYSFTMKTTIVQAFILATLAALGVCAPAPAPELVTRELATPASPPGLSVGYSGQAFNVPEPPAGITVKYGPLDEASRKRRSLTARQTTTIVCLDTPPPLAYTQQTLTYILNLNEVIYVPAYNYIYWETGTAVAFFVNSYSQEIYFGTTWLADNLQLVYVDCLEDEGLSGEIYEVSPLFYEMGLELGGQSLPLYLP